MLPIPPYSRCYLSVSLICALTCDPGPLLKCLLPDLLHLLALSLLYDLFFVLSSAACCSHVLVGTLLVCDLQITRLPLAANAPGDPTDGVTAVHLLCKPLKAAAEEAKERPPKGPGCCCSLM